MDKVWKAKWIMDRDFYGHVPLNLFHKQMDECVLEEHKPELKNRHMLVRKKFFVAERPQDACIDITADDYYKLFVNGEYIGQGPAPSYHFHYSYNRYDLKNHLKTGENVIAVHVYYQGLVNRVWNSGDYRQGLIAELFTDGGLELCTDETWKYSSAGEFTGGETTGYKTQYLENIDNRLKQKYWKDADFDDSGWSSACVNADDDHKLVFQLTPTVEVYKIKPVNVEAIENGHYIIDFGQEITGQFEMRAKGMNGQKIDIRCGEEMDDLGRCVRYDMRCNCRYRESWILSGQDDVLEQYDYKAFRYVEVTAPESVVEEDSFSAWVRHYPFDEEKCRFDSSDKVLNDIWTICKNGVKYGSQEGYLDCPTREKGQYLGDAVITALSHIYLTGDLRLYKKAVRDFSLSANICPGLMAVAPGSYMQEIADYSLQWPQMLLDYYRHSGDHDFLMEMYPTVEGIIKYFKKYERTDGLLENVKEKWNLVDWPQNMRDGYDFDLSQPAGDGCHNVVNAFYLGAVKMVNQIRDILKTSYTDEFSALHDAFIKTFYDEDTRLFVDSNSSNHSALHSNVIPLFYGLVPDDAKENVVDLIRQKRLCCGVYIAYYLLKGLAVIGEYELVYDLIMSEDERSWANMLREGATTCFEAWGKEQKQNTSLCHPWASAPIPVLVEDIIGLKPVKPGWETLSFTPHIPEKLQQLSLKVPVKTGEIYIELRDGKISIKAPDNVNIQWKRG